APALKKRPIMSGGVKFLAWQGSRRSAETPVCRVGVRRPRVEQRRRRFLAFHALASPMIDRQIAQRPLEHVAKAAALWIGPSKVAAKETEDKIVGQIFRLVRVAHHSEEIAIDRPVVAQQQLALRRGRRASRLMLRLDEPRPMRLDAAQ